VTARRKRAELNGEVRGSVFKMMKRVLLAMVLSFMTASTGGSTAAAGGPPEKFNPPKQYYLALGDSIAFGLQLHKVTPGVPASAFTGYVDVLVPRLSSIRPKLEFVNYGCPGETTTSFMNGGCPWTATGGPLHDPYQGSQLNAAVTFLKAHRGTVSPITLHVFGNDVSEFVASCGGDLICIQQKSPVVIRAFSMRLQAILRALRGAAPDAEIIVTSGWNTRVDLIPETDPLFQTLVSAMRDVAASERTRFVDLTPIFNPNPTSARLAALCTLTLTCSKGDTHPSDAGYVAIAEAIFRASGYAQLHEKH
jgi:lysophospholipase L1-like esterase